MPATEREFHALFLKAGEARRWTGKLAGLFPTLANAARKAPASSHAERGLDRDFQWRILPAGAVVGVRVRHDMDTRYELRIARADPLEGDDQRKKWDSEVATFLKHFGITELDGSTPAEDGVSWVRLPASPNDKGKTAARFIQLRKGETEPGKALCRPCLETGVATTVPWFPGAGLEQLCRTHAAEASRAYTAEVKKRLGLR